MISKRKSTFIQTDKSNTNATYEGKPVTIITVFTDIGMAMIEDENGNILDVKNSELREIDS